MSEATRARRLTVPARRRGSLDHFRLSEHIALCMQHSAHTAELANTLARVLTEGVKYDSAEPHLGHCTRLICDQLSAVGVALQPLCVPLVGRPPEAISAICDMQRQRLFVVQSLARLILRVLDSAPLIVTRRDEVQATLSDIERYVADELNALAPRRLGLPVLN